MKYPLILVLLTLVFAGTLVRASQSLGEEQWVSFQAEGGSLSLVQSGEAPQVWVDEKDWPGVRRVASDLASDFNRVVGKGTVVSEVPQGRMAILVGTLGRSRLIDQLAGEGKLSVGQLQGRWEAFGLFVVDKPLQGLEHAVVIVGSDKRGAIYGAYELSEQIGVSPWYYWADVPTVRREALWVKRAAIQDSGPGVKYRGIFLNDEAPALSGWTEEKFGGYNSKFYRHVFELILRLRGNYLWPAMWHAAFNEDDPASAALADEYGIVMGTSHHEPMLRAHEEWKRHGEGAWDYTQNADFLKKFWREGIRRNKDFESIITLGMRGNGDEPMSEEANVALLQRIVADQRDILKEEFDRPLGEIPQLWALYKEVQEYYERGMRVPDDITLLWCDDNWGNIRRLPTPEERKRKGGAGIYYHFDYVGGPRNYKWLNTNPIAKVHEQMTRAAVAGADRIWIVNVGDLKPMEFPIEFFLRMAWEPARWKHDQLDAFTLAWARRDFGPTHGDAVAALVTEGLHANGRVKPELLDASTYSLTNYQEWDRVLKEYDALEDRARAVAAQLPQPLQPAYYQLAQHPIEAMANVHRLYAASARNALFARQGRFSTNAWALEVDRLFARDAEITRNFNEDLLGGKWRHMMDQTHLGYTYWQQPPVNVSPPMVRIQVPAQSTLHVAGDRGRFGGPGTGPLRMDPISRWDPLPPKIEVYKRGERALPFTVSASSDWLRVSPASGSGNEDTTLSVSVDWAKAPMKGEGRLVIASDAGQVEVILPIANVEVPDATGPAFIEAGGVVAMDAVNFHESKADSGAEWVRLPGYGRTGSAITVHPVDPDPQSMKGRPSVSYRFVVGEGKPAKASVFFGTSLSVWPDTAMRVEVALDGKTVGTVNSQDDTSQRAWDRAVAENIIVRTLDLGKLAEGEHVITLTRVDPGVVIERVVVDLGGLKQSRLGPPQSTQRSP